MDLYEAQDDGRSMLLRRTVENEVDAKSVLNRSSKSKKNPYAFIQFLQRLRLRFGDIPSTTHSDSASRVHSTGLALVYDIRERGQANTYRLDDQKVTRNLIGPIQDNYLRTEFFLISKRKAINTYIKNPLSKAKEHYQRFLDGKISYAERKERNHYAKDFETNLGKLRIMGFDLLPLSEQVDLEIKLHLSLYNNYRQARLSALGSDYRCKTLKELDELNTVDERGFRLTIPEILNVKYRLNETLKQIAQTKTKIAKSVTSEDQKFAETQLNDQQSKLEKLKMDYEKSKLIYSHISDIDAIAAKHATPPVLTLTFRPVAMTQIGLKPKGLENVINDYRKTYVSELKKHLDLYKTEIKAYHMVREILDPMKAAGVEPQQYGEIFDLYIAAVERELDSKSNTYAYDGFGSLIGRWWMEPSPNGNTLWEAYQDFTKVDPESANEKIDRLLNLILKHTYHMKDVQGIIQSLKKNALIGETRLSSPGFFEKLQAKIEESYIFEINRTEHIESWFDQWDKYKTTFAMLTSSLPAFSKSPLQLSPSTFAKALVQFKDLLPSKKDSDLRALIFARLPDLAKMVGSRSPRPQDLARSLDRLIETPTSHEKIQKTLKDTSTKVPRLGRVLPFTLIFAKYASRLTMDEFYSFINKNDMVIDYNRNYQNESPAYIRFVKDFFLYSTQKLKKEALEKKAMYQFLGKLYQLIPYDDRQVVMSFFQEEYQEIYNSLDNLKEGDRVAKAIRTLLGRISGTFKTYSQSFSLDANFWKPLMPTDPKERFAFKYAVIRGIEDAFYDEYQARGSTYNEFANYRKSFFVNFTKQYIDAKEISDFPKDLELLKTIPLFQKVQVWKWNVEFFGTSPTTDELLLSIISNLNRKDSLAFQFLDKQILKQVHYQKTKLDLARWQLNTKFNLENESLKSKVGASPKVNVLDSRPIIDQIISFIQERFPQIDEISNELAVYIETTLTTTKPETEKLQAIRYTKENWVQNDALQGIDAPQAIDKLIASQEERFEMLRYLIGLTETPPRLIRVYGNLREDLATQKLVQLRRSFLHSDLRLKIYFLQPILDSVTGLLSTPESLEKVNQLVLGNYQSHKLISRLYTFYLEALPQSEQMALLGRIFGSMATSKQKSSSLKSILEALGPFGIRAGQFLRTSGLVPASERAELDNFFDDAIKPNRKELFEKLQSIFGGQIKPLEYLGPIIGSGSINYVVLADMTNPNTGKTQKVTIQISRENISGKIAGENEVWDQVIKRLLKEEDASLRRTAALLDEARRHAFEKLKPGGPELSGRKSRGHYETTKQVYQRSRPLTGALAVDVASPLFDFQNLIPTEFQDSVSIYEYIPNTRFFDLTPATQDEVAKTIVKSELRALFKYGVFDPDGHPGNWLYDGSQKRVVRIDYAQLTKIAPDKLPALRTVYATLTSDSLTSASMENLIKNASLIFETKTMTDSAPIPENKLKDALRSILPRVMRPTSFPGSHLPHVRILLIQQELQKYLETEVNADAIVVLDEAFRTSLSSLGRLAIYSEYMPVKDFKKLFALNLGIDLAKEKLINLFSKPIPNPNSCMEALSPH